LEEIYSWAVPVVLGLIVGSFLNVVIHRVPRKLSIVSPGSRCPSCSTPIRWYDNLPVLSYLLLAGKCRKCKTRISPRYPLIELMTGLLFVAARARHGADWLLLVRDFPFLSILVAVTFIDLDHRIIPNVLSYPGTVLGLATAFLDPRLGTASLITFGLWDTQSLPMIAAVRSLEGAGLGFALFYGLARGYQAATGRAGMGGGDVKLLTLIGAFLGPMGVIITILISSVMGSVVGLAWALITRRRNLMTTAIPYGPFLVVGALYYYLFGLA
jgi:leader peptidase (prepilin peptidase)/N-methyltransferase